MALPSAHRLLRPRGLRLGIGALASAVAASLALTAPAAGQTQPATSGPELETRSPFWGGGSRDYGPRYERRDRDHGDGDFRSAFPTDLAAEVAPARERYIALKWSHATTQSQLRDRVTRLRRDHENSEEYRDIARQLDEAQSTLRIAERDALAPLQDDPEYLALVELEQSLEQQIREAHRAAEPDMERIRAMSELAMGYSQRRRTMESALTANNEPMQNAREQLRELALRQKELDNRYEQQVREDEELASLRREIDDLRVAYLAAEAHYNAAVRTANVAMRFAYYNAFASNGGIHNPYRYYDPYQYGYWGGGLIYSTPGIFPGGGVPTIGGRPIISNVQRGGVRNTVQNIRPEVPRDPGGSAPPFPEEPPRTRD